MAADRDKDPYAPLAISIATWEPLRRCSAMARWGWISMLSSIEMRNCCGGLFPGSVAVFAEASGIPFGEAVSVLDELVEKQLVEHDPLHRIIRFTAFPSRANRPHNGSVLLKWWSGFKQVPQCSTRDRHVSLLRWLCQPFSADHQRVWEETFGLVQCVDVKSDTSDTVSDTVSQVPDPPSKQGFLFDSDKSGHRVGHQGGHHLLPLTIPLTPSSSGREHERGSYPQAGVEVEDDPGDLMLAEGTDPGTRTVPLTVPLTAHAMLNAIAGASGGRFAADFVDRRLLPDLELVARECALAGVTLADLDLAGRFLRSGGLAHRDDLGPAWAVRPGSVMGLVSSARSWRKDPRRAERTGADAEDDEPTAPRPASAFVTGQRTL